MLLVGYCLYGRFVEKIVSPDDRETPATRLNDGVDYVPMKTAKAFLVQLLNIAGTGPIFGIGAVLTRINFSDLWRYFSWSNQTLDMISLWVATAYLLKHARSRWMSLVTALPAAFMSAVSLTYILVAEEGLGINSSIAYPIGIIFAACLLVVYFLRFRRAGVK